MSYESSGIVLVQFKILMIKIICKMYQRVENCKGTCNPYSSVLTDDLVKRAVAKDLGEDARLIHYDVKDFTKKGDNYCSIVTSIEVSYEQLKKGRKSYVVKLNPQRDSVVMNEIMELMYKREPVVLSRIIEGMDKELKALHLSPIKTPKVYSLSAEPGKEAFVAEDLRKKGFQMFDRKKGMDISHAILVMEELGRFHSSSLLFEDTLAGVPLEQLCPYFEEPWTEPSNPGFKLFNEMFKGQFINAKQLLSKMPGYEAAVRWIDKITEAGTMKFVELYNPSEKFNLLIHGDCWNNNLLFKYDDKGNPVDIRLVDLQGSRKSSPACELNYFLYSSLNGDMRKENLRLLLVTYYLSFSKVFLLAEKNMPFTFEELEEEVKHRMTFGCFIGMFILPIVLGDDDEVMDFGKISDDSLSEFIEDQQKRFEKIVSGEGNFKKRFLMMFDEMLEAGVFDD